MINVVVQCSVLWIVVLGCETWSLILRDIHRLTVYGGMVLRKILGLRKEEKTEEWRK
jgi:hypothetical protein